MLSFLIYLGWENSVEVHDGQIWTNLGVEAIRCLFATSWPMILLCAFPVPAWFRQCH
jgi:hypothetical protein